MLVGSCVGDQPLEELSSFAWMEQDGSLVKKKKREADKRKVA
jgi:hypothetical protein